MKNKKLFAILTLLCFMFTLMPVAAFAADASDSASFVYTEDDSLETKEVAKMELDMFDKKGGQNATTSTLYAWVTKVNSTVPVDSVEVALANADAGNDGIIDNALTATNGIYELTGSFSNASAFYVQFFVQGNYTVHVSVNGPTFDNGKISAASEFDCTDAVVEVEPVTTSSTDYAAVVTFPTDSAYLMYDEDGDVVGTVTTVTTTDKVQNTIWKDGDGDGVIDKAAGETSANPDFVGYTYETVSITNVTNPVPSNVNTVEDEYTLKSLNVRATDVEEKVVTIKLLNNSTDKNYVAGATLNIEPTGAIKVDKETVTTDRRGEATFKVSGKYNGTYPIHVSSGQFNFTIMVVVGSTAAYSIECTEAPTAPVDILGEKDFGLEFTMYDVNGNALDPQANDAAIYTQGWYKAAHSDDKNLEFPIHSDQTVDATGYVAVVSQPAGSELENKDLTFNGTSIISDKAIEVEGTYEFRVTLDNGAYATATVVVKEFQTPVELKLVYPSTVELGATVSPQKVEWVDVNGVVKDARNKVDYAATGYAVYDFNANNGRLEVETDEKYIGSEITITAVDSRYNLIATAVVTVADDAKELKFGTKQAEVGINNKITVSVVDAQGKTVVLGGNEDQKDVQTAINYVVLDKPEGARVYVNTAENKLTSQGTFKMSLTSNVVGNVAIQAIVKYSATDNVSGDKVTKYYTGSQIFAVGNGSTGDVVVMSIGSNEIVINDAVGTIDAAPIVENNRTFVPFRALAEAFGATVAYDEATQAVTAELNGVTVVMTIGSAEYTVNGEPKTADVAPFINGSRTMVPVRFAAEAFGIKVIPTYDENGATADILFNL